MKALRNIVGYRQGMRYYQVEVIFLIMRALRVAFPKLASKKMVTFLFFALQDVIIDKSEAEPGDTLSRKKIDTMDKRIDEYMKENGIVLDGVPEIETMDDGNYGLIARRHLMSAIIALHEYPKDRFGNVRLSRYAREFVTDLNANRECYKPLIGQPERLMKDRIAALERRIKDECGIGLHLENGRMYLMDSVREKLEETPSGVEVTEDLIANALAAFGRSYEGGTTDEI